MSYIIYYCTPILKYVNTYFKLFLKISKQMAHNVPVVTDVAGRTPSRFSGEAVTILLCDVKSGTTSCYAKDI
jgi:hypothetical protein